MTEPLGSMRRFDAKIVLITGAAIVVDGGVTAQTGQPNLDRLYRERGWHEQILRKR